MISESLIAKPNREVRINRLILPTEHGSWGLLLEPLVAGLAIAFSSASPWIALLVIGAFMTRQPLKFFLLGLAGNGFREQTLAALRFTMIFGAVSATGLTGAVLTADRWAFFPFAVAAPLASYQIFCDLSRRSRELTAELTGAVAISSSVAAMALAGGIAWPAAMALWAVFIGRLVPSIIYVRNRLRLEKGKPWSKLEPIAAHLLALLFIGLLATYGLASILTAIVFAFLLLRCVIGLSDYRKQIKAMKIGIWEVIYGAVTVASVVAGYYLQV